MTLRPPSPTACKAAPQVEGVIRPVPIPSQRRVGWGGKGGVIFPTCERDGALLSVTLVLTITPLNYTISS